MYSEIRASMIGVLKVPLTRVIDYSIGIPTLNLLSLFGKSEQVWINDIRRVGVLCSPTMGDTVLLSGPMLDIWAHYGSNAEIIYFCGKKNMLAAELLTGPSRRIVIDLINPLAAARQMRAEKLDVLFDFSSWQRVTALLALLSGTRYTVGFYSPRQHRHAGYDLAIKHRADRHELDNFRALLRAVGIAAVAEPSLASIQANLSESWQAANDIVVLHPWPAGGPGSMREWPCEHWAAVVRALNVSGRTFAVTGSPAERGRSEELARFLQAATGARVLPFEGGNGLRQLVVLLRKAKLAVCVNTGVMHLAAAAGTPTVSLNGPTSGLRWGPRGRCCANVAPADGSGGYLHFGFEFHSRMPDVMPRILPEQVITAARRLLAGCGGSESIAH